MGRTPARATSGCSRPDNTNGQANNLKPRRRACSVGTPSCVCAPTEASNCVRPTYGISVSRARLGENSGEWLILK